MTPLDELKTYISKKKPLDIAIIVDGITDHRTTNLEDLTNSEISLLITVFKPKTIEDKVAALENETALRNMRSNVLALAERTGIKEYGNFHSFNNWMMISSKFKKHLNSHNLTELKELYQQLKAVERNNDRSANKPMTKAWWKKAEENVKLN